MKFDHDDLNALIRQNVAVEAERHRLPYTITPIGGKEALKEWKVAQEQAETLWQSQKPNREAARRLKAIIHVQNQDASTDLNELDKAEVIFLRYVKDVTPKAEWDALLKEHFPNPSLKTKLKDFVLKFFNSVFEK